MEGGHKVTNAAYQAFVQELEKVLPPRVVSRSLKDGLQSLDRTPDNVTLGELETLLRGQMHRQLQAMLPPAKADEAMANLLERINDPEGKLLQQTPAFGEKVRNDLGGLKEALRPFNLYFEWPEVQKLRAQLQLADEEIHKGGQVTALLSEAREQLNLLRQKLEDQLVMQARELAELDEAHERLRSLGGPRVRRLENLMTHIQRAQEKCTLVPAEIEQARLLSVDLRKLLESSVYTTVDPAADEYPDPMATAELLPDEVNEKLRRLDLENETHRLDQIGMQHANLLALRSELATRLAGLREAIVEGQSVSEGITALELALKEAFSQERTALTRELATIAADEAAMDTPVGTGQLRQALQVANGILATTLPDPADVRHVRNLYELAREQLEVMNRTLHDGVEMADARELAALELDGRFDQVNDIFQLEQELGRYPAGILPEVDALKDELEHAKAQLAAGGTMPDLNGMWLRLEDIRSALSGRLESMPERTRQALSTFRQVERLNSEDVAAVRRILHHLNQHADRLTQLSLTLQLQLEQALSEAEQLLVKLRGEFEATRNIADQLVSASILDDLLGGGTGSQDAPAAQPETEPASAEAAAGPEYLRSGSELLDVLISELAEERGVDELLLLRGNQPVGGRFSQSSAGLSQALIDLERDFLELGESLEVGGMEVLTIELPNRILALAWPAPGYRLLAIVGIPATFSLVLHRIRRQLARMHGLLDDPSVI